MDEVSSLRQNRGLTVRSIVHATPSRRCKTYKSKLCSRVPYDQENSSVAPPSSGQLRSFLTDAEEAINSQLCFSNCQDSGLARKPLIRPGLLSPCIDSDRALSSRVRRRRSLPVMNLPVLLLAVLIALLPVATGSNTKSKVPLVRSSDVTTHVFRGAVTTVPIGHSILRSVVRQTRSLEPLDFQTMKVANEWGDKYTNALLVSGRNFMYVFNASQPWIEKPKLMHMKLLQWNSTAQSKSRCTLMNNGEYECNNFIRIVEVLDGQLYVCGTNAYQPTCRYYRMRQLSRSSTPTDTEFVSEKNCGNTCGCPFNPLSTSAHLYANTSSGSRMFSAALIDYFGKKPLLMRSGEQHLQTVEEWLNEPTFVKMIEYGDKIYLFFVETASEVETGTGSPMKYARVAQVCKDDIGGSTVLRHKWSTFLKARLQCSIPGTQVTEGFTFNNLTSVSDVTQVVGSDGTRMDVIFATFTTPWAWNAVSMSAVCMFSMSESIQGLFNTGNFLGETQLQAKPGSSMYGASYSIPTETVKAVPVADSVVPHPRPGSCQNADVPDDVSSFTKNHPLMFDPVQPLYRKPIFTTESDVRLTQIVVDNDAGYVNKLIMYLGTEDARILRVRPRLADNGDDIKSVLLEETRLEDKAKCDDGSVRCGVLSMHLARPPVTASRMSSIYRPTAYIAFTDRIRQIIITTCKSYGKADCCNADPECGWKGDECVLRTPRNNDDLPQVNDLSTIPSDCQVEVPPPEQPSCEECLGEDVLGVLCASRTPTTTPPNNQRDSPACVNRPTSPRRKPAAISPRVVVPSPRNPQEIVERCADSSVRDRRRVIHDSRELTSLFNDQVLPEVEQSFSDTWNVLPGDQRSQLMKQLREALQMTTELVLRNHRKEYCLGTTTVNSLTHVYPLLMREVETWHTTAVKKMTKDIFPDNCWGGNECSAKATISVPLAPTLWEPMKNLMTDFGARCDVIPGVSVHDPATNCTAIPKVESCRHHPNSNSPHCQPKECKFGYPVDVNAFFRHANDSQKFLETALPLTKPITHSLSPVNAIRGRLELSVGENQPFLIQYSPVPEKVKISFHYTAVTECSLNDAACAGREFDCNPRLEERISSWFNSIWAKLTKKTRRCKNQLRKYENNIGEGGQQMRKRRNASNQLTLPIPKECRYARLSATVPRELWGELRTRAENRGGSYVDMPERITFRSLDSLREFFENKCSLTPPDPDKANFKKVSKKRKKKAGSVIRILPSDSLPFVIERGRSSNRIRLHFFTQRKTLNNGL
uniref:Uncharacterized protein LOC100176831 n=1 Tax=Phallusia mammillata TaxID=59560 RepID=A0A6F9DH77_9ASCI|nr:uncharacterized protein LOC100176831 [Phallusia mammillata]